MRPGIVLVSPKYPGNVGAVMRLMANFGLRTLHLVDPRADLADPAVASLAAGAETRVRVKVFAALPEALRPFHAVLATSSGRGRRKPVLRPLAALPAAAAALPAGARVALLFGAEDRGLSLEELALAHAVFRIPTHRAFPVMNLAQAVAIAMHAAVGPGSVPRAEAGQPLAATRELEGLFGHLRDTLLDIGFLQGPNPDRVLADLRQMALRARLGPRDVLILRGILRQVKNYPRVLASRRAAARGRTRGQGAPAPPSTRGSGSGR
jgi:TrmH family RNA methyltransferase